MPVTDDVQRLTREVWRLNMALGFQSRMGRESGIGRLAKAAGATQPQVRAWLAGDVQPTTAQALAVLDALPLPAVGVAELDGAGR
jgi:hypothetical protein